MSLGNQSTKLRDTDTTPGQSWVMVCRRWIATVLGLGFSRGPDQTNVQDSVVPEAGSPWDNTIAALADKKSPKLQAILLAEAMELLHDDDRQIIAARISTDAHQALTLELENTSKEAESPFASSLTRLVERLVWVVSREGLGYSPPERTALGRMRFQGETAQEVATFLRLPVEVVEHWVDREAAGS